MRWIRCPAPTRSRSPRRHGAPLRRLKDFERFCGHEVEVKTNAVEGRRSFTGTIKAVGTDAVTLEVDGEDVTFTLDEMKKATLKPSYDFKGSKEEK